MIVLHISLLDGEPFLWAETSKLPETFQSKSDSEIPSHPLDPGKGVLKEKLKPLFSELKFLKGNTFPSIVWLPARKDIPVPSTPLIDIKSDLRNKVKLFPFTVTVRKLDVEELMEVCSTACSDETRGTGIMAGNTLHWLEGVIRFSLGLVIRENFLPDIMYTGENWEARWRPVTGKSGKNDIQKFCSSMPAALRCMGEDGSLPPQNSPELFTNNFVNNLVDYFVRDSKRYSIEAKSLKKQRKISPASLHDAWIQALNSGDSIVHWDDAREIEEFHSQLKTWQRPVKISEDSPLQLCFRLSEPENDLAVDKDNWEVEYLLQPDTDPSLLLPVSDMWSKNSKARNQVENILGNAYEYVLTSLGQAGRLCPEISESLKHKNPGGFCLNGEGAVEFLSSYAGLLRGSGFRVILPSWWVGQGPARLPGLKVKVKTPSMQSAGGLTMDTLFEFDYEISMGGETLTLQELQEIASLKTPLVQMKGKWTYIEEGEILKAIAFLRRQENERISGRDLVKASLGAHKEIEGFAVDQVEMNGWLDDVLKKLTGRQNLEMLNTPANFNGQLRPYQERGYSWLSFLKETGFGACLADDMGLGKTIQALALIHRERQKGESRPVLLICPTSVVNNWRKEAQHFTPDMKVLVHHGADRRKWDDFYTQASRHDLVLSSYGLVVRDAEFLGKVEWSGIILDEAQNIKNPETKQSKAVRSILADYRIALTGTPLENHVGDIWSLMDFLNPGLLGSQNSFKKTYFRQIQLMGNREKAEELKNLTGPFILRRLKTDRKIISDLPDKIETKEFCTLTKEQVSLYKAVINELEMKLADSEKMERKGLILATLSKLKQVCNHPAQFSKDRSDPNDRSGKLSRLKEMLIQIRETGERSLIFTQYAEMGAILQDYLKDQFMEEIFFIHGAVPRKKRDEMIRTFQEDEKAPYLFILSLKAGGTGLNLTRANHVFHYDRWWNPAVENQATDRAYRIGQTKNVQVHKFIVAGTLEERIDEMIERKNLVADQVVGKGEQWLTELSDHQIKDLVKLGREASGE